VLKPTPLLWTLLGLFSVSVFWSARVQLTVFRLCGLWALVAVAWYIHRRLNFTEQARVLACSMGLLLLLSLVVVFADPELGIHGSRRPVLEGAWRGVLGHRNALSLGAVLAAFSLASLSLWGTGRDARMAALGAVLAMAMLWSTGSLGGWILLLAAGGLLIVGRLTDDRSGLRIPALIALIVVAFLAFVAREPLLELVGRVLTLSGRTRIWDFILEFVERRPILGHGYALAWSEVPSLQRHLMAHGRSWEASIHSGYLATAFWVGWPGLALLVGFLGRTLLVALGRFVHGAPGLDRVFPLALLVILLLAAIPEVSMMHHGHFITALLCALAFRLHAPPEEVSQQAPLGEAAE
jgi:O-antigen ligase